MAKVFTGKVAIPGDQIDQYLQALETAEAASGSLAMLIAIL